MKNDITWDSIKNPLADKEFLYELYHENSKENSLSKRTASLDEDDLSADSFHTSLPLPVILEKKLTKEELSDDDRFVKEKYIQNDFVNNLSILLQRIYDSKESLDDYATNSISGLFPLDIYLFIPQIEHIKDGIWHYNIEQCSIGLFKYYNYANLMGHLPQTEDLQSQILIFITARMEVLRAFLGEKAYRRVLIETGKLIQKIFIYSKDFQVPFSEINRYNEFAIERMLSIDGINQMLLSGCSIQIKGINN